MNFMVGFVTPAKPTDHDIAGVQHTPTNLWLSVTSGRVCECCGSCVVGNADLMNATNAGFTMGIDIEQNDLKPAQEGEFLYEHIKIGDHTLTLKLRDKDDAQV